MAGRWSGGATLLGALLAIGSLPWYSAARPPSPPLNSAPAVIP